MPHAIRYDGYRFCHKHGDEVCSRATCAVDFEGDNDRRMKTQLKLISDDKRTIRKIVENRRYIKLLKLGSSVSHRRGQDDQLECNKHSELNCSTCFNFAAKAVKASQYDLRSPSPSDDSDDPESYSPVEHATVLAVSAVAAASPPPSLLRPMGEGRTTMIPPSRTIRRSRRPQLCHPHAPRRFNPPNDSTNAPPKPFDLFSEALDRAEPANSPSPRWFHKQDDRVMLVFTDGACLDQGKARRRAGWGFVFNSGPDGGCSGPVEGTVGGPEQTSNRAEIRAAIAFLQMCEWEKGGADTFVIAMDSMHVVNGVSDWIYRWLRNGWRLSTGGPVLNQDLWQVLNREVESAEAAGIKVLFWWIKRELNTQADRLAKMGADAPARPVSSRIQQGIMQ